MNQWTSRLQQVMCFGVVAGLLWVAPAPALGVPVRILSRSYMDTTVLKEAAGIVVIGQLRDDNGVGVANAPVTLAVDKWGHRSTETIKGGVFRFVLSAGDTEEILKTQQQSAQAALRFQVSFGGDGTLGSTSAEQVIDLKKETLSLQVIVSPKRLIREGSPRIHGVLRYRSKPAPNLKMIAVVNGKKITASTGGNGQVSFRGVPRLKPGDHEIVVLFPGNQRFNRVSVKRKFTVVIPTTVTMDAFKVDGEPYKLRIRGTLAAADKPLQGSVSLVLEDKVYGYAHTLDDGMYSVVIDLTKASNVGGARNASLRGVYTPSEPWELPSRTPALVITIPPPPRVPILAYVGLAVLVGLLLLCAYCYYHGHFSQLIRWLRQLRQPNALRPGSARYGAAPLVEELDTPAPLGLHNPSVRVIGGLVWNALTERPAGSVSLTLRDRQGEPVQSTQTDECGVFSIQLDDGYYTLVTAKDGFVEEQIDISIPHSGVFANCRIRLTPIRALTLTHYERFVGAVSAGDSNPVVGRDTPREIETILLRDVKTLSPGLLANATERFETLYFAGDHRATLAQHNAAVTALADVQTDLLAGKESM